MSDSPRQVLMNLVRDGVVDLARSQSSTWASDPTTAAVEDITVPIDAVIALAEADA